MSNSRNSPRQLLLLAALALGSTASPASAGDESDAAKGYHHSFKGTSEKSPDWEFFGPNAAEYVRFEPEGLRIALPAGYPDVRPPLGLATRLAVKGDFEVTVRYEILNEPEPENAERQQTRFTLDVVLNSPHNDVVTLSRRVQKPGGFQYLVWIRVWDDNAGKPQQKGKGFPASAKSGRLRIVRTGPEVSYYQAEGSDETFTLLETYPFREADVREIRVIGSTGGPRAALDVRVTDLHVRAGSSSIVPAPADKPPEAPKTGWLAAGLILGLAIIIFLTLGVWLVVRQRRRAGQISAKTPIKEAVAVPEAVPAVLAVSCASCGKNLKVKTALAGKKVKCPQCGHGLLVPGSTASKSGRMTT